VIGTPADRGRPRTVLYIEDDPSILRLVELILAQRPQVTLLTAADGRLGLDLARLHRPALVLLDLNLHGMSGEEVLRRLRGNAATAATAVVIVSAQAAGNEARLRGAGADGSLGKPFGVEQLLATVDAYSAGDRTSGPAAARSCAARGGPPITESALDLRRFGRLRGLYREEEGLTEFVASYREDMGARIEVLEGAARGGDPEAVRIAAHTLAGGATVVGARRLGVFVSGVESRARAGELPGDQDLAVIRDAFRELEAAFADELAIVPGRA